MSAILKQLGVDNTVFIQLIIYTVVFFALSKIYFKPFLKLFETRHKKTVQDREAAEKLLSQAQEKLDEYTRRLNEARQEAKRDLQAAVDQAKREETEILSHAREQARKISQDAANEVDRQAAQLRKQLEADVDGMARTVSEKLLLRKV